MSLGLNKLYDLLIDRAFGNISPHKAYDMIKKLQEGKTIFSNGEIQNLGHAQDEDNNSLDRVVTSRVSILGIIKLELTVWHERKGLKRFIRKNEDMSREIR